jgi:hypothetical protein
VGGCSPRAQIARGDGGCPPAPRRKPTLLPCGAAPADSGRESGAAAVAPAPGFACQALATREAGRSQPRGYASLLHSGRSQPGDLAWIQASFPASPSGPAPRESPSEYARRVPSLRSGGSRRHRLRRTVATATLPPRCRQPSFGEAASPHPAGQGSGRHAPPAHQRLHDPAQKPPGGLVSPAAAPPQTPPPGDPLPRGRVHTGGEGRGKSPYWRGYAPAIFWGETKRLGPEYGRRAVFLCQDHGDLVRRFAP